MKAVFADTSFFVAFLCERDRHHAAAADLMSNLGSPMVTTRWVLAELGNLLCRWPDRAVFMAFLPRLLSNPNVQTLSADDASFDSGMRLFGKRQDKDWSLTDCISISVMAKLGLTDALTTDHHFQQAGFNVLLR